MATAIQVHQSVATSDAPVRSLILQRCCSQNHNDEQSMLRRHATGAGPLTAPPIVHDVLRSPGQPLDAEIQVTMGAYLSHDFSQVRVHTDPHAARSVDAVNAHAYTVGRDIVFGANRYTPASSDGAKLLTHELTHVIQNDLSDQTLPMQIEVGAPDTPSERQADHVADQHSCGERTGRISPDGMFVLRRQTAPSATARRAGAIDTRAEAIIQAAADTNVQMATRAVQVVRSILNTYFAAEASLVTRVDYDASVDGLSTDAVASPTATGVITVGSNFLAGTTRNYFARRVLQVDHELEHIRQHRQGMGGRANQPEREFLAFYREALATAVPGTGRVPHSTRVALIDEALRNYCKLTGQLQNRYSSQRTELISARARHQAAGGHPATPPPTCPISAVGPTPLTPAHSGTSTVSPTTAPQRQPVPPSQPLGEQQLTQQRPSTLQQQVSEFLDRNRFDLPLVVDGSHVFYQGQRVTLHEVRDYVMDMLPGMSQGEAWSAVWRYYNQKILEAEKRRWQFQLSLLWTPSLTVWASQPQSTPGANNLQITPAINVREHPYGRPGFEQTFSAQVSLFNSQGYLDAFQNALAQYHLSYVAPLGREVRIAPEIYSLFQGSVFAQVAAGVGTDYNTAPTGERRMYAGFLLQPGVGGQLTWNIGWFQVIAQGAVVYSLLSPTTQTGSTTAHAVSVQGGLGIGANF